MYSITKEANKLAKAIIMYSITKEANKLAKAIIGRKRQNVLTKIPVLPSRRNRRTRGYFTGNIGIRGCPK